MVAIEWICNFSFGEIWKKKIKSNQIEFLAHGSYENPSWGNNWMHEVWSSLPKRENREN